MDRIAKALTAHDAAYQEVAEILFGDGADELIRKISPSSPDLSTSEKKKHRRQAQIGLASNVLGITAGGVGTVAAGKEYAAARRKKKGLPPKPEKVGRLSAIKGKHAVGLAGGALALQGANLGGDFVANRVLARSAKKKKVQKSDDSKLPNKGKLVRLGAEKGKPAAIVAAKHGKRGANKLVETSETMRAHVSKSDELDVVWEGEISKMDTDRRQVFGWASVTEINGEPVHDLQGDIIGIDEIEKAAYDYVQKSRKGGDMHRRNGEEPYHASTMIESMIFTPEKIEKMGLPANSVPIGWWTGYQVHDEDLWQEVKKGKRTGFSIHGRGKRREV